MAVFVDTNVFVYARDASEPIKQPTAIQWLEELWSEHRGRTSTQVLNEYYVTVTRKLEHHLDAEAAGSMDFGGLFVRNPFTAKIAEGRRAYTRPRTAIARHRPRGRPRSATR